ncbi:hypothetical protein [Halomonas sp. GFAJ-1]|uniref:hypothetical protein n=1 Tax=Halomonas sp. GFAJ-1 TaxID=1118153 RepID=UPI00023A59B3|nr:hypothetical protein [Halomonas sp. GFAJ-1]AVI61505.1 hypothetical protein BB497_01665 [Halomonas sp. GFAJ-1]EHK60720.1 hypothetical protein MOY_09940 [Halomonas sp. GFAJ-1]
MKVTEKVEVKAVTDVVCDVCLTTTRVTDENLEYATLKAHWGYGSQHDGERYEVHLCESCFFRALAYFKQERRVQNLFSEDSDRERALNTDNRLGIVATDDYFRDRNA